LPATSSPETSSPAKSSAARLAVIAAYQAMTQRLGSSLAVTIPQAQGDVLAMYPEYWWLRHQVQTLPRVEWPIFQLQHFLKRYRGTYLADALRIDWLLAAAKAGDFETVDSIAFVKNSDAQFKCAKLEARVRSGHPVTAAQALQTFAPGTWCWSLYNQLVARRVLGWHELKTPLRDAIEHDSVTKARQYASYLFEPSQQQAFETLLRNPMLWLLKQRRPPRGQANIELVTLALARLGRVDLSVADRTLRRRWAKNLPKQNVAWIRTQFALVAALKLDPRAHDWYKEAGHIRMSPYNAQWRVRAALRRPKIDWQWVITAIERMDKETQTHPDWVYWRARGLAALGAHEQARRHYAKIANRFTFYGQLAAEELGRRVVMPPQASPVTDQELKLARAHPGLQRAIALFRLGWREQALSEWRYALQGKNDRQKLAIAALAHQEQLHDRVINTSIHTQQQFDVTQRYIVPFEGRITAKAKQVGLDSAWVHGLIRQESYFHLEARSSAGAAGLMQLMPGTAKWIARKIGWASFSLGKVTDFEVNTHLGMVYLHRVLQELDGSQVLASAGYNAGASRPRRWRAALTHVMEGAIFAETIPFTETRNYVKNVMAHATCYAVLFSGRPQSLKQRLGQITPQPLLRPSVYQPYRPPYRESL
jgi:soluble lytic murein transglycosylase